MPTTSKTAQIPFPVRADRVDGPGAFESMARRLDDITVVPYANATARGTAYATSPTRLPTEGTLSYLMDTNVFEFWNGTNWTPVLPDDYSRGVVYFTALESNWPTDVTYVPANTERMMTDLSMTVTLYAGRVYKVAGFSALVDGGPGSSPTAGGADLRIRYNQSATPATITSNLFTAARVSLLADSSINSTGSYAQRIFVCGASGAYSWGLSLYNQNPGGARTSLHRELVLEDLGKLKQSSATG